MQGLFRFSNDIIQKYKAFSNSVQKPTHLVLRVEKEQIRAASPQAAPSSTPWSCLPIQGALILLPHLRLCRWKASLLALRLQLHLLHLPLPPPPRGKDGGEIGQWISQQRKIKRELWFDRLSTKDSLPKFLGRMFLLEEAGFKWEHKQYLYTKGLSWDDYLAELVEYKRQNGDCNVTGSDTRLGRWVVVQRAAYKARTDDKVSSKPLTDEQVRRLDELGFRWTKLAGTSERTARRRKEKAQTTAEAANINSGKPSAGGVVDVGDSNAERMAVESNQQAQVDVNSYYYDVHGTFGSDGSLPPGSFI